MVLNDLTKDYSFLFENLNKYDYYYELCEQAINDFSVYESSRTSETSHVHKLDGEINPYFKMLSTIAKINASTYMVFADLKSLESLNFKPLVINDYYSFCNIFTTTINAITEVISSQFQEQGDLRFTRYLIDNLQELLNSYKSIVLKYNFLCSLEDALYEPLPADTDSGELRQLEIQSYNKNTNFSSCVDDLALMSQFITRLETILKSDTPLYTRKIESGTFRIVWSGGELEVTCIADIINAIVEGIRSLAFLPSDIRLKKEEKEKLKLENETLNIENTSKKLAIINSQIDIISEKLNLDKSKPEDVEIIQQLCLPLIGYLENNPTGNINGKEYDIDNNIKLLTFKNF